MKPKSLSLKQVKRNDTFRLPLNQLAEFKMVIQQLREDRYQGDIHRDERMKQPKKV